MLGQGKNTVVGVVAAVVLASGWGCGQGSQEGEFRFISSSAHHSLDPQRVSWLHDIRIVDCLFEPLIKVGGEDFALKPGVAARWEVSGDGLRYTFYLRPEARWSNGDRVGAGDFVYAWRRALLPDSAADYTQLLFCIRGAEGFFRWRQQQLLGYVDGGEPTSQARAESMYREACERFSQAVGVSAPDEGTLVVELARPTPYFLELCSFVTFMPVHAESVESSMRVNPRTGMATVDPSWTRPGRLVCNGPYVLKESRFKQQLLLEANPYFWDRASVRNRSVLELVVENPQTMLMKYDGGEVDWLPDIPTGKTIAGDLVRSGREDVHVSSAAGTYFYSFNCEEVLSDGRRNPLADPRVRRALSMGIDRRTIVEKVTRLGRVQPVAWTFVPPGVFLEYVPPVTAGVEFNPAGARELLREAGYADGAGLRGLSVLYNVEGGHEAIAQQVKRCWESELNVSVKLEGVDSKQFGHRLKSRDYTICRASWFGDYRDPTTFLEKFQSDNGNNDCGWRNRRYDALLVEAAEERDERRRLKLLTEAEALMLSEQPVAPIYHYVNLWLFDAGRVQGLQANPWNFRRLDRVRVVARSEGE